MYIYIYIHIITYLYKTNEHTLWYSNTAMDNFPFIHVHPLEMIFPRTSLFECFKTIYDSIDDFIIHIYIRSIR